MIYNSLPYTPTEKHWAYHPLPGSPNNSQWWYHDAISEDGFTLVMYWLIADQRALVGLHITDANGNNLVATPPMPDRMVTVYDPFAVPISNSTEGLDFRIGDNYLRQKSQRREISYRNGNTQVELVFEAITQGAMEPPDGVYIGRRQAPTTAAFMSYFIIGKAKVTGKLIVDGREITFSGIGYCDHQYSNTFPDQLFDHWYWGTVNELPKHSIVYWDGQLSEKMGCQRTKWLWVYKEEKLIHYSRNANMYIDPADLEYHPGTGVLCPRKLVFTFDEPEFRGTITKKRRHMIAWPLGMGAGPWPKARVGSQYFRYISDVEVDLEVAGEKVKCATQALHEMRI